MIKKPNLFIVGAPKSGTTSLYNYLKGHSDAFMSEPKEPYYFCDDFRVESDRFHGGKEFFHYRTQKEYLNLFKGSKEEKVAGEASTIYLYSKVAAKRIFEFNPEAKIIIMIREPVDFLNSLHAHFYYTSAENISGFKEALTIEDDRKKGKKIPKTVLFPSYMYYSDVVRFSDQIQRYLKLFPRDQIKLIVFDDFTNNTKIIFEEVLEFLDIDPSYKPEFKVYNPGKKPRLRLYTRFARMHLYRVKQLTTNTTPIIQKIHPNLRKIHEYLRGKNRYVKRQPLEVGLRKELMQNLKSEVEKLSKLFHRDLVKLWGYDKV
jgi:hypothetical protein